jgi:hypothetical protein
LSGGITHRGCLLPSRFAAALVLQIPPQDSGNNPRFREAPGKSEGDLVNAFDGDGNTLAFPSHHPKVPPLMQRFFFWGGICSQNGDDP